MPRPRKVATKEQKEKRAERVAKIESLIDSTGAILHELAKWNFNSVLVDWSLMDEHVHAELIIDEPEMNAERIERLRLVCQSTGAKLHLRDFYTQGFRYSRLTLWPESGESDA